MGKADSESRLLKENKKENIFACIKCFYIEKSSIL